MQGPSSMVFYLDYLVGTTKGSTATGTAYFDARTGPINDEFYPSGTVPSENPTSTIGTINVAKAIGVAHTPLRPGSISGTILEETPGSTTFYDDGNGTLILSATTYVATGTVVYGTGIFTFTPASGKTISANGLTVSYDYDTEANDDVPAIDLQLTAATIQAEVRKLRARWSMEAAQNLEKLHGINAESELVGVLAEVIKASIDRRIVNDIYAFANAGSVQWDKAAPAGVPYAEHKLTLIDALIQNSTQVYRATKRAKTNWVLCGTDICNVIESLPMFKADADGLRASSATGARKIGMLQNRWVIIEDPFFPSDRWLTGYRGESFLDSGYVYAPYIPLVTTQTIYLDDFMGRKGAMTQFGVKSTNSNMFATGQILNV